MSFVYQPSCQYAVSTEVRLNSNEKYGVQSYNLPGVFAKVLLAVVKCLATLCVLSSDSFFEMFKFIVFHVCRKIHFVVFSV